MRSVIMIDLPLDDAVLEVLAGRRGISVADLATQLCEEFAGRAADSVAWHDAVDRPAGIRTSAHVLTAPVSPVDSRTVEDLVEVGARALTRSAAHGDDAARRNIERAAEWLRRRASELRTAIAQSA